MRRILACLLCLLLPVSAGADDWRALESPTAVVLMRHALAPGTGDPAGFVLGDCGTQRDLDARGQDQARRIGAALRDRGVTVDAVWTSQWCRCRDTAHLLDLGEVREVPALNSFFARREMRNRQTAETLALIATEPARRLVLVTHQVNITALTGIFPRSGEIIVAERSPDGLTVTGRIPIDP